MSTHISTLFRSRLLLMLGVFSFSAAFASGQMNTGEISGAVKGPSAASIAGARVVAKQSSTGLKFTAVADVGGEYLLAQLPVGTYKLTADAQGFKQVELPAVTVLAGHRLRHKFSLELGDRSEVIIVSDDAVRPQLESAETKDLVRQEDATSKNSDLLNACLTSSAGEQKSGAQASAGPSKPGSLTVFGSWRFRTEAWDWFRPTTGENSYAFAHSLLRAGISQTKERFEWLVEGAQDAILGLPDNAIAPGGQGQLGLGGTYFAANGNRRNNANGFVKQAYFGIRLPLNGRLTLGRFGFSDGTEVTPKDPTVAQLVNNRIAQRLIGEFNFSAVMRSFDGVRLAFDTGKSNFTLLAVRPTEGAFQVDAIGELNVDLFYGGYTIPTTYQSGAGELRIFALGYLDQRQSVVKTDNRPLAARTADIKRIRIGTYGADYVHVFHTSQRGQFNFLVWGLLQNGSWGSLTQRAGAFVGEFGWQPPIRPLNPWFSAGYSFGSGDSDAADNRHGTFFQVLPTPRLYARFPFYIMENNEDFYGTAVFRLRRSVVVRSELHALRLANARDLWYVGGGAFQPHTFGYTGRLSGGNRSLANAWDVSLDFPLRYGFSVTTYYAHAWGKSVIASIYAAGTTAQFGYVETNFRF